MVICKICDKEYASLKELGNHLKSHNISTEKYYIKYLGTKRFCYCGNKTRFLNLNRGFIKYCSHKCAMNSKEKKEKTKQTTIKRYGVENIFQSKEMREKIKRIMLEKYGVYHSSQNEEVKEKAKQTCLDRYNVKSPAQNKEIMKKQRQTNLERYGFECSFRNKEVQKKYKKTMLERYGVEYPLQNEEIRKRTGISRKKNFLDPKYCEEYRKKHTVFPNNPEKQIINLLNTLFPDEYKYTGDFSFWIEGKNPDFTNTNGKKKIIELFGNYWHSEKVTGQNTEFHCREKIDHYKKNGYDALIIWESELKGISKLKEKIINFHNS